MLEPNDEAQLSEVIAGATGPLRIIGGGTRGIGSPVQGEALSTAGLTGISLYEPGALTLVAKTGTPLSEIEAALAKEGQRLAFEPMDHRGLTGAGGAPTIGGVVAANVSGPRRVSAGACRDHLLGVRFVDGSGTAIKNGGRVMKNVTGYDLVKLLAGSYGTLGVLSEVSLKVLPVPPMSACLMVHGLDDAQALAAMTAALRSPYEVTGAAHVADGSKDAPVTMIRLEGFETQITHRVARLKDLLGGFGEITVETNADVVRSHWADIRDVAPFHGAPGDVWRISVKPSEAPDLVAKADALGVLYDWGGGLIWLRIAEGTDLRTRLGEYDGHATLIRASEETRRRIAPFQPEPAAIAALTKGLRAKFDPRGILNPGLME